MGDEEIGSQTVKRCDLRTGETIRVGRSQRNQVVLSHPGVSNLHMELKLIGKEVGIVDLSSCGTGVQAPGKVIVSLEKRIETILQQDSLILLPMKVGKSNERVHKFIVH